ncbi:MAG: TonB-dependent receptor [Psychrobium sp.]
MKNRTFKATLIASALASAMTMSSALAADKNNGSVAGQVAVSGGQNLENVTVVIKHNGKGFSRTTTTNDDGKFNLKALPAGQYTIEFVKDGYQTIKQSQLTVLAGNKANYDINMSLAGVETISVTGQMIQRIDMASSTASISFDAEELSLLPVAQDTTSIALLSPATSLAADGSGDYGRGVSFNGSSVAENGVFLNGLNITDIRKGLGNISIPWEAIGQTSVISGGVGAEYGNFIGGVTDYVSKSGGNEFKFGVSVNSDLGNVLNSQAPTTYRFDTGHPNDDGTYPTVLDTNNTEDYYSNRKVNVWASGALIEDTLFFYALLNPQTTKSRWAGANSISERNSDADYWFGKLDWVINDNHNIGVTALNNEWEYSTRNADYEFMDGSGKRTGDYGDPSQSESGGSLWSVNYSGVLTDELTVSAVYGVTKQESKSINPSAEISPAWDNRTGTWYRIGTWTDQYASAVQENERKQFRVDFDYEWEDHTIRFGYSSEKVTTYDDTSYSGDGVKYYLYTASSGAEGWFNEQLEKQAARLGTTYTPVSLPQGTEYIAGRTYTKKGSTESNYVSFYIEDSWAVNDQLTLNLGLRNSAFDSYTGTGEKYVEMSNQIAPRLGVTYDLFEDGGTKLFANYGRYFMPISPNTSARMVLPETNSTAYALYDDAAQLNDLNQPGSFNPFYTDTSSDGELAQPVSTYVDKDLDPMYSDEIAFGFSHEINEDWIVGAKFTYQNLKSSIEDTNLVYALTQKWGKENPEELEKLQRLGLNTNVGWLALVVNPGNDIKLAYDVNEDGTVSSDEYVEWSAEYLGLPKAERKYKAIELTTTGQVTEELNITASYTWSRSEGNTEGLVSGVHSQADPGWSGSFDAPELTDNSYGRTSNDIPHKFKLFGTYRFTDDLVLGFNASAQSGRPINKLGYHPQGVGSCAIEPKVTDCSDIRGTDFYYNSQPSPRGSHGHSDWIYNLDLSLSYNIDVSYGSLSAYAKVYNVFDSDTALTYNDVAELEEGKDSPNYRNPTSFQTPRYMSVGLTYKF